MKIIIPILGFSASGGGRVLSYLATEWIQMGHEVVFLVNEYNEEPYFPTHARLIWINDNGVSVTSSRKDVRRGKANVIKNLLGLLKGLNKYADGYDVIFANHSLTAWPVNFCSSKAKKIYYVQAYEPEYYPFSMLKNFIVKPLSAITYLFPLDFIVNSPVYFKYKLLQSEKLIPPGIDFSIFYPKENAFEAMSRKIRIGCIGRKEKWKGIHHVVKAYEIMLKRQMPVRLCVAYGDFPKDTFLDSAIYDVVIPKNDYELADYYRSVDILIAPGLVQLGAPHYPVMEAMACGTSVITTGYMPANINNAYIVPVGDVLAIVDKVKLILTGDDSRIEKVRLALNDIKQFSWPKLAEKMIKYFFDIV